MESIAGRMAVVVRIKDIHSSQILQEGDPPTAVFHFPWDQAATKVNVMAMILKREDIGMMTSFFIDDGSGQLLVRCFGEKNKGRDAKIGSCVLLIGKIREFAGERYLSPDILREISPLWLRVRAQQLIKYGRPILSEAVKNEVVGGNSKEGGSEEGKAAALLPAERLTQLIRQLDDGKGAPIEDILAKSPLTKTEELLARMMEHGDIFQIAPGRVKIL